MPVLYERVGNSNILSCFVVGRPRPEYGLPVAVYMKKQVLGTGYWVLDAYSDYFFMIRCGQAGAGIQSARGSYIDKGQGQI